MLRLFYNYYYNNSNIEDGGEWQTILNCRVEACVFYGQLINLMGFTLFNSFYK